jgi:hypothetical protein
MKKLLSIVAVAVLVVILVLIIVADFVMPKSENPPLTTSFETAVPTNGVMGASSSTTASTSAVIKKVSTPASVVYTSTITRSQNNKVVYVKKGGRFTLALGDLDWTITIGDTSTVGQIQNFQVVKGVQGTYTGIKVGTTTIRAEGRPHCDSGKSCLNTITNFKVTIVVK